jgi:hypothetical protein
VRTRLPDGVGAGRSILPPTRLVAVALMKETSNCPLSERQSCAQNQRRSCDDRSKRHPEPVIMRAQNDMSVTSPITSNPAPMNGPVVLSRSRRSSKRGHQGESRTDREKANAARQQPLLQNVYKPTHALATNAELSRSRRRLNVGEAGEQPFSQHRRKQKGWRLSAPAES